MSQRPGFRLGVAQSPAELTGVAERLAWLDDLLSRNGHHHADLLVLPELFATGYNAAPLINAHAEPKDGPIAQKMAALCAKHQTAIVYGYPEAEGGQIYNAAQALDTDGKSLGHHRKLAIPPGFERQMFAPGQGINGFDFRGVHCAILICYDAEFPETARQAAANGAEVLIVPTALGADWGWVAGQMIPTRGFENGVYLAYANSAGVENSLRYLGQSVIAAPDGRELARAAQKPTVLVAEIDPAKVSAAQQRLPYLIDRQSLQF